MTILQETPSAFVLLSLPVVIAVALALWKPKRSLVDVAMASSALAAIAYVIFHSVVRGGGALWIIGLGNMFFLYLPLTFVTGLLLRVVLRKKLRAFRGAPGIDEPSVSRRKPG